MNHKPFVILWSSGKQDIVLMHEYLAFGNW